MDDLGIGIDIGASKIVVAVCQGVKAEVVLNSEGCRSTKFCVAFNNKERLFSDAAEGQFPVNPENTIHGRDVKQIIGLHKHDFEKNMTPVSCPLKISEDHDHVKYCIKYRKDDQKLFPEHILTMFLVKIKNELESLYKRTVSKAVITVPSMFNSFQRFAVKNAVLASGIEVESILNDSTASAITYMIERHGSDDKNILIFDMGASSTDVAVVQLTGNTVEVKACGGNLDLGGNSFVLLLLEHFVQEFEEAKNVRISDNKQYVARLRFACEKFKKMLSATSEATCHVETFYNSEPYQLKMKRETFEGICHDLFKKVEKVIKDVVRAAKCNVDEVIMVGNGGRIPKVEVTIAKLFGKELSRVLNQDESVAMGAAYYAARNVSKIYRVKSLNVKQVTATPLNFFIDENGIITLIKRGKFLPLNDEITYTSKHSFQACFFQGDFRFFCNDLTANVYDILSDFDKNGLLKILLMIENNPNQMTVVNHQKLSNPIITQIQSTETMFEKHEIEYKKAMEMKNELEKICLGYKRKFNSPEMKELLSEDDIQKVKNVCFEALDWLDDNEIPKIREIEKKMKNVKEEIDYCIEKSKYLKEVDHANLLMENKNFQEASSIYNNILNKYSNFLDGDKRVNIMFNRVSALMEMKKFWECVRLLNNLFYSTDNDSYRLLVCRQRAKCNFELKNFKECAADLHIVLNLEQDEDLQKMLSESILQQNVKEVENLFEEANNLTKVARYDESNSKLDDLFLSNEFKFLTQRGNNSEAKLYMMKAQNNFMLKNYKRVLQDCQIAAQDLENLSKVLELQVKCHTELDEIDKAQEKLTLFELIGSYNNDGLNELKRRLLGKQYEKIKFEYDHLFKKKQYQSALKVLEQINVETLEKSLKTDHFCKQAAAFLGLCKYSEGVECCGKALNLTKKYLRALELRAECYFQLGEFKKAIDDCDVALKQARCSSTFRIQDIRREAEKEMKKNEKRGLTSIVKNVASSCKEYFLPSSKADDATETKEEQKGELEREYENLKGEEVGKDDDVEMKCDEETNNEPKENKKSKPNYMKDTKASQNKQVKNNQEEQQPRRSGRNTGKTPDYGYDLPNDEIENMETDEKSSYYKNHYTKQ